MKKKIIAFLSSLAVSTIVFGGIVVNATEPTYAYDENYDSTFWCEALGPNISVRCNGTHGTVRARNSYDYYFYKYVEITNYEFKNGDFDMLATGYYTGNTKAVDVVLSASSSTTNKLVIGLIGYSSIAQTGWHYAGVTNSMDDPNTPPLPLVYYNFLDGYDK